jgi:hypothetical protein
LLAQFWFPMILRQAACSSKASPHVQAVFHRQRIPDLAVVANQRFAGLLV